MIVSFGALTSPILLARGLLVFMMFINRGVSIPLERKHHRDVCETKGCVQAAAILLGNMDSNQDPCDDFYRFACGGFEAQHLALDKEIHVDTHLDRKMLPLLKRLLSLPNDENEPRIFQNLKSYYSSCVNVGSVPERGIQHLQKLLEEHGGWPILKGPSWNFTAFSWQDTTAKLMSKGLYITSLLGIDLHHNFDFTVTDSYRIIQIRAPYVLSSQTKKKEAYRKLMENVAIYLGAPQDYFHLDIEATMKFLEDYANVVRIAKNSTGDTEEYSGTESDENFLAENSSLNFTSDTSEMNLGKMVTVADLYSITDEIDWAEYLSKIFPIPINSATPIYLEVQAMKLKDIVAFIMNTPNRVLANFILWKVVYEMIDYAHDSRMMEMKEDYRNSIYNLKFSRKIRRWIVCLREASTFLTPALTALYAKYYFPQHHKDHVMKIFERIHYSVGQLIEKVDWLDNSTKDILKTKLSKSGAFIAYPNELLIDEILENYYTNLSLSDDEYLFNILHLRKFHHQVESQETLITPSSTEWSHIDSLLYTNAYYYRFINAIVVPLSQLRGIYFSQDRIEALNFGSLGAILGHELFHGVNEFGLVKYNHKMNWWTPEDTEAFLNQTKCTEKQYNTFPLPNKTPVDGLQTLDENLADNSGLKVAYMAYRSWVEANGEEPALVGLKEFNGNQLFWLAFANAWCTSTNLMIQSEVELFRSHSPNNYRVIGSVQNMEEFADDFGCPSESRMNPTEKCGIW